MATWSSEEVFKGTEKWLKARRDEQRGNSHADMSSFDAIDSLLNELRDAAVEGWLPWERIGVEVDD